MSVAVAATSAAFIATPNAACSIGCEVGATAGCLFASDVYVFLGFTAVVSFLLIAAIHSTKQKHNVQQQQTQQRPQHLELPYTGIESWLTCLMTFSNLIPFFVCSENASRRNTNVCILPPQPSCRAGSCNVNTTLVGHVFALWLFLLRG